MGRDIVTANTPHGWYEVAHLVTQGHWNNLPYYRPLPRLALGLEKIGFGDVAAIQAISPATAGPRLVPGRYFPTRPRASDSSEAHAA